MTKFDLKLGCYYDITYLQKQKVFNKPKKIDTAITLNKLMFYKTTPCYYIFWTGREQVRIARKALLIAREL